MITPILFAVTMLAAVMLLAMTGCTSLARPAGAGVEASAQVEAAPASDCPSCM